MKMGHTGDDHQVDQPCLKPSSHSSLKSQEGPIMGAHHVNVLSMGQQHSLIFQYPYTLTTQEFFDIADEYEWLM